MEAISRRSFSKLLLAGAGSLNASGALAAASAANPGRTWERFAGPEQAGFSLTFGSA